jgi:archaeosine-15-forming tRNA-guanine transglycosylase
MTSITLKTEIPVEFDSIVDRRTVVHELALDGDEGLRVGDHVALVNDGVSLVAVVTDIDDDGYLHLALR